MDAKRAVGYIRVSTQGQADEGIGLQAQEDKIRAWCIANDYELAGIYRDEGLSGTRTDRPGLTAAIKASRKGDAFIVYAFSRIARSTSAMLEIGAMFKKRDVDLVSVTEKIDTTSAAGRMIFQVFAVLSEFERNQTAERTKAALAAKRLRREPYSPTPFGFELVRGRLKEVSREIEVVQRCLALRQGGASYRGIASELNKQGITGKQGGKWHASTVRYMLQRQA